MKRRNRYDVSGLEEAQFEHGSQGRVLKNRLGIISKREMDRIEGRAQVHALEDLTAIYAREHCFTAADICRIHKVWLRPIYRWAGQYRQVNISKDDFPFAAPKQIPRLMAELEKGPLRRFTPCHPPSLDEVAMALAVVHVELVLIHPFRDGNGRAARLLAILMGLQAGLPTLFFGDISGRKRKLYFAAVQAGLEQDYEPMTTIFSAVIRRTLEIHGQV
ncbi:MAG: Fic/DOC family protein [Nitrospiraceae bacterium]